MKKGMTWLAAMAVCVTLAAPAQAADPIKIGVQGAQSGDLASYGVPSLNAVKIVVDQANAKGGLLGRTIEVVAQDDQCKPEMATNAATKLISEKVNAVVGPICSGPTKASLPMFQEAALIAVSPTATTPGLTEDGKNPLFFRTVANDNAQAALTSDFMLKKAARKPCFLKPLPPMPWTFPLWCANCAAPSPTSSFSAATSPWPPSCCSRCAATT